MDVCLILSQRIEEKKDSEENPARWGRISSAISKTIEFPSISKPQAIRSFIHASKSPVPPPPKPCPEFVPRPGRPSVRCAALLS